MRPLLGASILLAMFCTMVAAADPTPEDAVQLIEKLKGKHLPKGKSTIVDLGRKKVTDNDLKVLSALKTSVQQLNLAGTMTKDKTGKKTLYTSAITDDGVKHLGALTALRKLELDGASLTDEGLKHLSEMKNLTDLSLSGTKVTDAGMEELKKLPNLKVLNLYDTKVTDTGISVLKRWKIELKISQ